jgi:hypothetical protein
MRQSDTPGRTIDFQIFGMQLESTRLEKSFMAKEDDIKTDGTKYHVYIILSRYIPVEEIL